MRLNPILIGKDKVEVAARAEGPGGLVGDAFRKVSAGGEAFGYTFDELAEAAKTRTPLEFPRPK